jgi:hypothetical protein
MNCREETTAERSIGGVCLDCISRTAKVTTGLTPEQRRLARASIQAETSGLFPLETLKSVLEDGYDRLAGGEPFDTVIEDLACEVQRLGGLGMCREMLKVTEALGDLAHEQEEEIRRKIRSLANVGRDKTEEEG